jgi:CheY-like chemotaxis protein
MASRVLIVESDSRISSTISQVLGEGGHDVSTLTSFEDAMVSAATSRPDLLIAGVRLGRFNGLHLATRLRAEYPSLPIIILGQEGDAFLAAEAIQLQARFLPINTPGSRLKRFVEDLLSGGSPLDLVSTRRWERRSSSLPVRTPKLLGWAIDVGYGGLRIETAAPLDIHAPVDVTLPTVGMDLKGTFRWIKPSSDDKVWWVGFELDSLTNDTKKWRRIVDSLPAAH